MSLYDDLGIAEDADVEAIKAAYRKMAMKYHPDREGGDEQKFRAAKDAYEVLSDPDKRKVYDETGVFDSEASKFAEAERGVIEMVENLTDAVDLDIVNVRDKAIQRFHDLIAGEKKSITSQRALMQKYQKAITKWSRKSDKPNFLTPVFEKKIAACADRIDNSERNNEIAHIAIVILEDFEFDMTFFGNRGSWSQQADGLLQSIKQLQGK